MKHGSTPLARPAGRFDLPLFAEQRSQFSLRFTCEHCCNFVVENERCAHGYPNGEHRAAYYDRGESDLVFCKEFELQ